MGRVRAHRHIIPSHRVRRRRILADLVGSFEEFHLRDRTAFNRCISRQDNIRRRNIEVSRLIRIRRARDRRSNRHS